jgi:hypothetical protein
MQLITSKTKTTQAKTQAIWGRKMSEREAAIRKGTYKEFNSFSELNKWINSELANKLYKISMIDWEKNLVQVEGRSMN